MDNKHTDVIEAFGILYNQVSRALVMAQEKEAAEAVVRLEQLKQKIKEGNDLLLRAAFAAWNKNTGPLLQHLSAAKKAADNAVVRLQKDRLLLEQIINAIRQVENAFINIRKHLPN
ncbi:hypothetical protein JW933_11475 [candidate division FCPU426 bacterium]|nr:hypothetical protein [candidate division FCPU426 bacterium]